MSEPISALPGARKSGMVELAEAGLFGMITLRGDPESPVVARALRQVLDLAPPARRRIIGTGTPAVAWMSPDELLILVDHAGAAETVARLEAAVAGEFVTLADVSDARAVFTLSGVQARDVLAKLCPVDFTAFEIGEIRRTRAAQAAVALMRRGEHDFTLICFRSVARYVFDVLATVSRPGGEVGLYR